MCMCARRKVFTMLRLASLVFSQSPAPPHFLADNRSEHFLLCAPLFVTYRKLRVDYSWGTQSDGGLTCLLGFLYTSVTVWWLKAAWSTALTTSVIKQLGSRLNNPECRHQVSADLLSKSGEHLNPLWEIQLQMLSWCFIAQIKVQAADVRLWERSTAEI